MRSAFLVVALLAASALAWADVVYLVDGRKFEGEVSEANGKVTVQTKFGPVTFPRDQVIRIEKKQTPAQVYEDKARALTADDVEGHFQLGLWCKSQGLRAQALVEFNKVIALNPDHAKARAELDFIKIDGKWVKNEPGKIYGGEGVWLTPTEAVRNAQAEYKLAEYAKAREKLDKAMAIGLPAAERLDATVLAGKTYERLGLWKEALAAFTSALKMKPSPELKAQLETRMAVIRESTGYMYLVKETVGNENIFTIDNKDPEAPKERLSGLQPLTNPAVMYLAIHDKASLRALNGKDYLEQAKKAVDGTDKGRTAALKLLDKAETEFAAADLIVKDIARGFEVEAAKQRLGILEKVLEQQIAAYQGQWTALNQMTSTVKIKQQLPQMYQMLSGMEKTLEALDQVARKFPDELADEVAQVRNLRNEVASAKTFLKNLHDSL